MERMERINRIIAHPLWRTNLQEIEELERERIFCGHDLDHFLQVARMAYIESLERGLSIPKEEIYAAALLHDIGRSVQYAQGIPHDQASAALAEKILDDAGFDKRERAEICRAIGMHRDSEVCSGDDLAAVLYRADKQSRPCFCCPAAEQCNWEEGKKNTEIRR